jgi:hypothetical protein
MATFFSLLVIIIAFGVLRLFFRRDPNKWYGDMICETCQYQWLTRRKTPPAACPRCRKKAIKPVTGATRNSETALSEAASSQPVYGPATFDPNDPLINQATSIVRSTRRATVSGIQRHLRIGYNQATQLMQELERIGVVSSVNQNGERTVLDAPTEV